jgi:hypothetical protein
MAYEVAGGALQLTGSPRSDSWSTISRRQPAVVLVVEHHVDVFVLVEPVW